VKIVNTGMTDTTSEGEDVSLIILIYILVSSV